MRHVASVAGRELRSLFVSPVAYGVLSLFAVLAGVFFILFVGGFLEFQLQLQRYPDQLASFNLNDSLIREFFGNMGVVLLFLIPGDVGRSRTPRAILARSQVCTVTS